MPHGEDFVQVRLQSCLSPLTLSCTKWSYNQVREVHKRRYLLRHCALEVFSNDGQSMFLIFHLPQREKIYQKYVCQLIILLNHQWTIEFSIENVIYYALTCISVTSIVLHDMYVQVHCLFSCNKYFLDLEIYLLVLPFSLTSPPPLFLSHSFPFYVFFPSSFSRLFSLAKPSDQQQLLVDPDMNPEQVSSFFSVITGRKSLMQIWEVGCSSCSMSRDGSFVFHLAHFWKLL